MCVGCLRDFGFRAKLIKHLSQKSPRCLAFTLAVLPPLPAGRVSDLDKVDADVIAKNKRAGRPLLWHHSPVVRISGPLPFIVGA